MERKLPYEEARLNVVLLDESDIVTISNQDSVWNGEEPDSNVDNDGYTGIGSGSW